MARKGNKPPLQPRGRRQDADQNHPRRGCRGDLGTNCRVSARPDPHPRVVRGQHPDVRRATQGRQGHPKKHLVAAVEPEVRRKIAVETASLIGEGVLNDFQAIKTEARRVALQIMGQAVVGRLNADRSDERGPHLPCDCGGEARFTGHRPKTFTTALGPLTLKRAWYHCDHCRNGFSPRDRALGMEDTFLSPATLRMIGIAATRTSFEGSSGLLRELAGLAVAPKTVGRHAEAFGREIAGDEVRVIEPKPSDAPTLYLGLDGTGVPARKTEVEGREGKQPDGATKTREAKIAVVWSVETPDKDGRPVRDPGSATYNAAIETIATRDTDTEPAPFARRIIPRPGAAASTRRRARSSSATARHGSGTSSTSTSPTPSGSSTSSTPRAICSRSPRPSTGSGARSATTGQGSGARSSTRAASTK